MRKTVAQISYNNIVFVKFAAALIALIFTSLSISETGHIGEFTTIFNIKIPLLPLNSLVRMPETAVYFLFGLLHTFIVNSRYNKINIDCKTLNFMSDWLLFTAFYKLVLLPSCGFGYFEWIILVVAFFFEFSIMAQKKFSNKIATSFDSLLIFGFFLFLFKVLVRYALPQNLSPNILENETAMNLVTILVALLAFYGIKSAVSGLKLTKDVEKGEEAIIKSAKGIFPVISQGFAKLIGHIADLFITLVTNPIVLLIVLVAVLLLGIVGAVAVLWKINDTIAKISTDIKQFIAPILRFVLETDNPTYTDDVLNTTGSIGALIVIVGVSVFEWFKTKEIKENLKQVKQEEKEEQELIEEKTKSELNMFFSKKNESIKENNTHE